MKKHIIIINMTISSLALCYGHYIYIRAIFYTILSQLRLLVKIAVVRIEKNITLQKMIKKGLKKNMINFLQMSNKLFSKKKRQINKNKKKISIKKSI